MALVMVVEDEVDMSNLIRDHLVAEGHEVEQAFDGRTALDVAQRRSRPGREQLGADLQRRVQVRVRIADSRGSIGTVH